MGGLSRWAVRKPWWALGAWAILVLFVFTLGGKFGGTLNDSFSRPRLPPPRSSGHPEPQVRAQSTPGAQR